MIQKRLCILSMLLVFPSIVSAQDITTGLIGHWKFDEGSGTTAADSSGNGNTGTLTNGPTWTTGKINNALSFDGIDDYVNLGTMDVSGSAITIAMWVNADMFPSSIDTRFISKAISTSEQDHYWMLGQTNNAGDKLRFRLKAGGTTNTLIASSGTLPTNTWFHAVATYDGSMMRLYKDGVEVGSMAKSGTINTDNTVSVNIGRQPNNSNYLDGTTDDIRIYNRALTTGDIQALYAYTGGPPDTQFPTIPTGLTASAVSSSQINLSWNASTDNVGVTGYRVYRGGTQIASPSGTTYSDASLSPSTTYSYTVAAIDAAGNVSTQSSSASATTQAAPPPDTQAPTAPTNLSATAQSSTQINLTWTASTDNVGVAGYRVERCQGAGCTNFGQISTPTGITFNDTGLIVNTAYRYQVRAADSAGNLSLYSSIANATTQAPPSGGGIPAALGWYEVPNTRLRPVCAAENGFPDVWGVEGCGAITADWSSGAFDTARNRLFIWGGGHNGYYGNELYALDLDDLTMQRLTDPGLPTAPFSPCVEAIVNGTQPNSRHTYDGIEYIGTADRFFAFGGALACGNGYFGGDTWTFNFSNQQWQRINPLVNPVAEAGIVTAYDPNTQKLFLHDRRGLYSFDPLTNAYTLLSGNTSNNARNYHSVGVIDTKRKKFVIFGNGDSWIIDISAGSSYALQSLSTSGGSAIVNSFYPGLAYDPISDRIVAWIGGNTVYSLNLDTNTWTTTTYAGGPTAMVNGTYGRWNYSPALNVFVSCNSVDANCYTLRLTSGTTPPPDTQAPTTPIGLTATAVLSSQINLSWTASADNIGVTGYRVERCQGSTCTNFSQIATPTGTTFNDTGLTANTTYRYQVRAVDAANNFSNYSSVVSATTQSSGGSSADADFQARCSVAGVVKCWAFDNTTTDIIQGVNLFPDGSGVYRGGLDTAIKTSGTGSLRFTVPPPPHAGANIAGKWEPYLPSGAIAAYNGQKFGPGDTFYTQIRMRLSPDMLTNTWDSYWKFYEMIYNQSTCGTLGIVYINQYLRGIPTGYTDCGGQQTTTLLDGQTWTDTPPLLLQQGDYNCQYGFLNPTDCFYFPSNEWMTFYFKVRIGTWGQPNSSIEAWVSRESQPLMKKWQNISNYSFSVDLSTWGFNNAFLGPYMTALSSSSGRPGVTSYLWYDEFIISTQPIAAPGGTAPTTLVGDLNNDRTVNGADWSIMAGQWFTNNTQSDLNRDGVVNSIDFSLMNANWGMRI